MAEIMPVGWGELGGGGYLWPTDSANLYDIERYARPLHVPVHAPGYYFKKGTKSDAYSDLIRESKKTDLSEYFMPFVSKIFTKRFYNTTLLVVVPASKVGEYSPTLNSIALKLSLKNFVNRENIICRIKETQKCTETPKTIERAENVKDTMVLKRSLELDEKVILLLNDTKASGVHLLECAKLITENKKDAHVAALCLGINKRGV